MVILYGPLVPKIKTPEPDDEAKKREEAARRARAEAAARSGRSGSILTGEVDLSGVGTRPRLLGG